MPNPTRAEAIKYLLNERAKPHLAALYHAGMETQVNVAKDEGELKDGFTGRSKQTYTTGIETWYAFRCPKNAWHEPEDNSGMPMTYSLMDRADAIGMTGWNFKDLRSIYVAYDFDAIVGHSEQHTKKMDDAELLRVQKAACAIPWVQVQKSTSGSGLHLYVFYDEAPSTKNHDEHAALARATLSHMSALVGFDFSTKVDVCGSNIWVWARRSKGTDGFSIIKPFVAKAPTPPNWRQQMKVVRRERKKTLPEFAEKDPKAFDQLAGQHQRVALDDEHKKLISWLNDHKCSGWWDSDHHILVTHTKHLENAHAKLEMRGAYKTNSDGSDLETQNCFSGDTEVLTKDGPSTLRELAQIGFGELLVQTYSGLVWKQVEVKSFGTQTTYPVIFGKNYSVVRATREHQWLYVQAKTKKVDLWKKKYTFELVPGKTVLPLAKQDLPIPDERGIAHGFVFGDGWVRQPDKRLNNEASCEVAFFKEDIALLATVNKFGKKGHQSFGEHYVPVVRNLPADWKELPYKPTRSYAFGFILGLLAADGYVRSNALICQSDFTVLCEVERLAKFVGLRTFGIKVQSIPHAGSFRSNKVCYALSISTYNLKDEHLIRKDQREKLRRPSRNEGTTVNVLWSQPKSEEVFCAIVPDHHNFTLANGVITGNCWALPFRDGAWLVRRYTPGVEEDKSWEQDGRSWTKCWLNREPDLRSASRTKGGTETEQGSFSFNELHLASEVIASLGGSLRVHEDVKRRSARVKPHKDGKRIVVEVERESKDSPEKMAGWYEEKNKWKAVVNVDPKLGADQEVGSLDELLRHATTESRMDAGWFITVKDSWNHEPSGNVSKVLATKGYKKAEADALMGASILNPWTIVSRPFQDEYPGDRLWNRSRAQYRYPRVDEPGPFPHWEMVYEHLGKNLDAALAVNGWALANDVKHGKTYLMLWMAAMLQHPYQPLPYLFFWSSENDTGKSIFHESADLLISDGCVEANLIFNKDERFNPQMEGAVLCYIEEMNLKKNKSAYEKIKNWVTSPKVTIRKMYLDPYQLANTTHWVHTANDFEACPVFPGDTRITVIHVPVLDAGKMIAKPDLLVLLKKEAPHFLSYLLNLEVPPSGSRLRVPVVDTSEKQTLADMNYTPIESFIQHYCHAVPGEKIAFSDFYDKFVELLDAAERGKWQNKNAVSRAIPPQFLRGKINNVSYIANISWELAKGDPKKPYALIDGKLVSS